MSSLFFPSSIAFIILTVHLRLSRITNYLDAAIVIKPSNIRIWIHDKDIGKLTQVLWEGQGNRLRTEMCSNNRVKKFLDAVPYVMVCVMLLLHVIHTIFIINLSFFSVIKKECHQICSRQRH